MRLLAATLGGLAVGEPPRADDGSLRLTAMVRPSVLDSLLLLALDGSEYRVARSSFRVM